MLKPIIPNNESQRIEALKEYMILDSVFEKDYDDITNIASEVCMMPISLVSLVDTERQWFKSSYGLDVRETSRDYSFCAHAINTPNIPLIVEDATTDERFSDNPLVTGYPNVIFYAGFPLVNLEGHSLGSLCVIDSIPRQLTSKQIQTLQALSRQVVNLLELRKANRLLQDKHKEIEVRNANLQKLAYVVAHDLKAPITNIISLISLLKEDQAGTISEMGKQLIEYLQSTSGRLKNLIEGILSHYLELNKINHGKTEIDLRHIFEEVNDLLNPAGDYLITFSSERESINVNVPLLRQTLVNLLSNAIKYNDKEKVEITVKASESSTHYWFKVSDNGIGMSEEQLPKIFETFVTLGVSDRFNNVGTGIGLATVKEMIEKANGTINVKSTIGKGSEFMFSLAK